MTAAEVYLRPGESEMTPLELDVCNEWVARISRHPSQEDALRAKSELLEAMKRYDKWEWVDDVHMVRDISTAENFLVVVDMCSGPASEAVVRSKLEALNPSGSSALGNLLQGAKPLYYSESAFEGIHGRISADLVGCKHEEVPFGNTGVSACF